MNIGTISVVVVAALVVLVAAVPRRSGGGQLSSLDFNFAGCAAVTMCPTDDVAGLAHEARAEVTTRKAALPFDDENDVVVEVYNSWYELFRALRELAKSVPVRKGLQENSDAAKLVEVLTGALNEGPRPHLTTRQARFRRCYDEDQERPENADLSPQDIQRTFPQYDEVVSELKRANAGLMTFGEPPRQVAHERERAPCWQLWRSKDRAAA